MAEFVLAVPKSNLHRNLKIATARFRSGWRHDDDMTIWGAFNAKLGIFNTKVIEFLI